MEHGTVAQLTRYPLKSMGGEHLESVRLTALGIPGDRAWAVFDESRDGITNAKRLPLLRACRARFTSEPVAGGVPPAVRITFPDGSTLDSDSPAIADRLSTLLGRRVSLRHLGHAGSDAAPRISGTGDSPDQARELMGLAPGEPLPDLSEFPPETLSAMRVGNFFDALPIHLLTSTTLDTLARLAPESVWDARRFRPNLLVRMDDADGFPELGWLERRVRVGTAVLDVHAGCPRCVMATQPVDELPRDPTIMRTLVRETNHTAGIYASVVVEGEVAIGSPVELLDPESSGD